MSEGSYLPPIGLAAAMMEQRACNDVTMPALLIEMLCCSIASWMLVRSWSFICTYTQYTMEEDNKKLLNQKLFNTTYVQINNNNESENETWFKQHYFCYTVNVLTYSTTLYNCTLSNSSIRHTPLSANTNAPASRVHSLVTGLRWT